MKYNGKTMKELVSRSDWQELRKSFIGTWKKTPKENVKKLRIFLGDIESTESEKLLIVFNYLTGSVFRIGIIKHPDIEILKNEIKEEIKKRKESGTIKVTKGN
jgi:hypothetical protein